MKYYLLIFCLSVIGCNSANLDGRTKFITDIDQSLVYEYQNPLEIQLPELHPNDNSSALALILDSSYLTPNSRLIYLESSSKSLFSNADKIRITDKGIFIIDLKVTNDIYHFDSSGKFINSYRNNLKNIGLPADFDVVGDTLLYLDQKMVVHKISIKDKGMGRSVMLPYFVSDLKMLNSTSCLLYNKDPKYNRNQLLQVSLNDTILKTELFPIANDSIKNYSDPFSFFSSSQQEDLFALNNDDTIYSISNGKIKPKFVLSSIGGYSRKNAFTFLVDSTLHFSATKKGRYYFATYSMRNGNVKFYNKYLDQLLIGGLYSFPIYGAGNKVYYIISPEKIIKNIEKQIGKISSISEKERKALINEMPSPLQKELLLFIFKNYSSTLNLIIFETEVNQ